MPRAWSILRLEQSSRMMPTVCSPCRSQGASAAIPQTRSPSRQLLWQQQTQQRRRGEGRGGETCLGPPSSRPGTHCGPSGPQAAEKESPRNFPRDLGIRSPPRHACTTQPGTGTHKGVQNWHQWVRGGGGGSAALTSTPTAACGGTGAEQSAGTLELITHYRDTAATSPGTSSAQEIPSAASQTTKPSPQQCPHLAWQEFPALELSLVC